MKLAHVFRFDHVARLFPWMTSNHIKVGWQVMSFPWTHYMTRSSNDDNTYTLTRNENMFVKLLNLLSQTVNVIESSCPCPLCWVHHLAVANALSHPNRFTWQGCLTYCTMASSACVCLMINFSFELCVASHDIVYCLQFNVRLAPESPLDKR